MWTFPMNDPDRDESQIECSLVFTRAGSFKVTGAVRDALGKLAAEEWPVFTLADNDEQIVIRSSEVAAIQHIRGSKGRLGFTRVDLPKQPQGACGPS